MEKVDELSVPGSAEDESHALPVVAKVADTIGALATVEGLIAPERLETAMSVAEAVGKMLGEPSLIRVLTLRALSSPSLPRTALAGLKSTANILSAPERAAIMRELARLVSYEMRPTIVGLGSEIATALDVPLPNHLRADGGGILGALGSFAHRARSFVHSEPPILVAARDFGMTFGEAQLVAAVAESQQTGDHSALIRAMLLALDAVRSRANAIADAVEAQEKALSVAQELDAAADQIERVARQRYAAITRRATLLKRHIVEDFNALVEDAVEEFEVDFRRLAEKGRNWFGKPETADLNDRLVVKNLERRYRNLARRYQDELDLLDREVSDYSDEFTRVADEALRPMARHEFRAVAPHPALELRVKAAVDRATTRTLMAGAAGAVASGAAVHSGVLAAGAALGVAVTPVGVVILGAVTLAGVWKVFASPGERQKRDSRERARSLEDELRREITANLPPFMAAVDAILGRFRATVVPDIARPRVEAERIREIASAYRTVARGVVEATNARIDQLVNVMQISESAAHNLP